MKQPICILLLLWLSSNCLAQTNRLFCNESLLTFNVSNNGHYNWYNAPTGGTKVGGGNAISVPRSQTLTKIATDQDTVYALYAEGVTSAGFSSTGAYGAPSDATQGSQELKIAFTTFQSLVLDSLTISISQGSLSCSSNKNPKINLSVYKPKDSNFPEIKKTITFTCVGPGEGLYKLPVNLAIENAGEYALKVSLASPGNTYRLDFYSPSTNPYPKTVSNLISLTSDDDGDDNTYLVPALFDWVISLPNTARLEAINTKDCSLAIPTFDITKSEEANVFPNPFQEHIHVEWRKQETAQLSILDANGKLLVTQQLKGAMLTNIGEDLKPGLYLLKIDTEKASYLSKIIKK